jgi:hypothetical protein
MIDPFTFRELVSRRTIRQPVPFGDDERYAAVRLIKQADHEAFAEAEPGGAAA